MVLGITAFGVGTGSPLHALPSELMERWGFGRDDLWHGAPWAYFTSLVMVRGPVMFWGMILFAFATLGVYEWRRGTRAALAVFWLTELAGLVLQTLLVV